MYPARPVLIKAWRTDPDCLLIKFITLPKAKHDAEEGAGGLLQISPRGVFPSEF